MTNTGNRKTEYNSKAANHSGNSVSGKLTSKKQFKKTIKLTKSIISFATILDIEDNFRTNEDCIKFLEELYWNGKPESPYDPNSKVYKCKDGWYKCKNTGKEFNVLTGTFLENTKIKLPVWFRVIFRMNSDRRGVPAALLTRDYGLTETAALFMLDKIRHIMGLVENFQKLSGIVETDEYSEGGTLKNMHYDKKLEAKEKPHQNKKILQAFISRTTGNATLHVLPDLTDTSITTGIYTYVEPNSTLYTDDNPSYKKLLPIYNHKSVNHSKCNYVDKDDPNVHSNSVESFWSTMSRTSRTYINISVKYIQYYANEVVYRYNTRKMLTWNAVGWLLQNMKKSKITWAEIRAGRLKRRTT